MRHHHSLPLALSAALFAGACAATTGSPGFTTPMTRNSITRAELQACGMSDPYEAVKLLRPGWLRPRVRTSLSGDRDGLPLVYTQNMRFGRLDELAGFRMEAIQEIRFVHPLDATTRWGMGHTSGVIEVIWVDQPLP